MCWSWEVSLVFSTLQFISIGILCWRNSFLDRWFAFIQTPVATQEFLQCLLWAFAIDDGTTRLECSAMNVRLTFGLLIVVEFIPVALLLFVRKMSRYDDGGGGKGTINIVPTDAGAGAEVANVCTKYEAPKHGWQWRKHIVLICLAVLSINYAAQVVVDTCLHAMGSDSAGDYRMPMCTYARGGHQIWGHMNVYGVRSAVVQTLYVASVISGLLFRPLWTFIVPTLYGLVSVGYLAIWAHSLTPYTKAFAPLWCWSCSALCLWWLLLPYLVPAACKFEASRYAQVRWPSLQALCRVMFDGTAELKRETQTHVSPDDEEGVLFLTKPRQSGTMCDKHT